MRCSLASSGKVGLLNAQKLEEIEEHRRQAEALLPETAEAHFLRP